MVKWHSSRMEMIIFFQWMEKMPDGTNIFRNSRLEEREAKTFEEEHHRRREKLFIKIQEEFEKEIEQPGNTPRFRAKAFFFLPYFSHLLPSIINELYRLHIRPNNVYHFLKIILAIRFMSMAMI